MAVNFPNSPSSGDVHSEGGASWRWSGYAWRRIPDPGAKGEPGEKGQKGEIGSTGSQGDKGDKGAPSTVAGDKGQKGEVGVQGSTGSDGDKGQKGEPSTTAGDKGDKGDIGSTGTGTKGEKGAGSSVTIGVSPPTSPTPVAGDMWWDSDDADLHVYYSDGNSNQWVSVTSSAALKGQTGDKGQKGEVGEKGQKGEVGAAGSDGDKGQKGEVGAQGGTGGAGDKGQKGEIGADNSTKGQKGEVGAQGADNSTKGQKGEIGADNSTKGQKGEIGASGTDASLPSGFIGIWSGAANAIPSGWYLCDGSNSTPDLRSRFIVGASASGGYSVGATGGADTVTLAVQQLPAHSHGVSDPTHGHSINDPGHKHTTSVDNHRLFDGNGSQSIGYGGPGGYPAQQFTMNSSTTGISIQNTGGGNAHENRPPYYALCYIMKS